MCRYNTNFPQTSKRYYLSYSLLVAAHVAIVWWLPYFPSQDGPSHIYNLVILRDLLNGGQEWGRFFECRLSAVPNLGFNLLAYPLLSLFSPLVMQQIFLSAYIVLMGLSVPFFVGTFGRQIFPNSLLMFPMIFNGTLMMGFYSYVVAIPFFILAFSVSYRMRGASLPKRLLAYNIMGIGLYYLHLIAWGIYLLSLVSIALAGVRGIRKKTGRLLVLLLMMSPVITLMLIYLYGNGNGRGGGLYATYLGLRWLLSDLFFRFSTVSLSPLQEGPAYVVAFVFMYFLILGIFDTTAKRGKESARVPALPNEPRSTLLILLALLLSVYLLAPNFIGDGSYFNQRFPWVMFLLALPLLAVRGSHFSERYTSGLFFAVSVLTLTVNAAVMQEKSASVERFMGGLSLDMPRGAFVMTYKQPGTFPYVDVLLHAASYYGISKGAVDLGNYEAERQHFLVRFRKTLPPLPGSSQIAYAVESIALPQFPSIAYVLAWQEISRRSVELAECYDTIYANGPFAVLRRKCQGEGNAHYRGYSGL